jgi:hypothetical protein
MKICMQNAVRQTTSLIATLLKEYRFLVPPVESMGTAYHAESKVTACHATRGTRSPGDNIREGDAILEVAMDDDKDLYAECRTQGIPSLHPSS